MALLHEKSSFQHQQQAVGTVNSGAPDDLMANPGFGPDDIADMDTEGVREWIRALQEQVRRDALEEAAKKADALASHWHECTARGDEAVAAERCAIAIRKLLEEPHCAKLETYGTHPRPKKSKPDLCVECGLAPVDFPQKELCSGCEAYTDHQK